MTSRPMATPDRLFVYGTLRRRHGAHALLGRAGRFLGDGVFQGRLYDLGPYPGAVPSGQRGDRVLGEVYRLVGPESVLERLDAYEGCHGPCARFQRQLKPLAFGHDDRIWCWIYVYMGRTHGLKRIASGEYSLEPADLDHAAAS